MKSNTELYFGFTLAQLGVKAADHVNYVIMNRLKQPPFIDRRSFKLHVVKVRKS